MFRRLGISKIIIGSLLIGSLAKATEVQSIPPDKPEASGMDVVIGKVLNAIERASLQIEFEGSVEKDKGLDIDLFKLSGNLQFNQDINMPLIAPNKDPKKNDPQVTRLFPTLNANTKGLGVLVDFEIVGKTKTTSINFYSSLDSKKQTQGLRPLTLQISNKMNDSLLELNIYSIKATILPDPKNPDVSIVKGSCVSDQPQVDINTGRSTQVKMDCEFNGEYSDKTYNIHMKYLDRK